MYNNNNETTITNTPLHETLSFFKPKTPLRCDKYVFVYIHTCMCVHVINPTSQSRHVRMHTPTNELADLVVRP